MSHLIRRSTAVTAGAVVFAGLVAAPVAAHAAEAPVPGTFESAVTLSEDPDGLGQLYTLGADVRTYTTIALPDHATLDANGHTITAVEDADHRNFPGPVLTSAVGTNSAPAELDVKNLDITTEGFEGGSSSNGLLNGIYMHRAGGDLSNVSVTGISHGNGVQEGNAISIRNRVSGDDTNVPRAHVALDDIDVENYQKTGLLLDGNLTFTVTKARIGQGAGPTGQPNPTIAANSLQISRGASGSVTDSVIKLNSHEEATAVLLFNAKNVELNGVTVNGDAAATTGIHVSNTSNTVDTAFTMTGGAVTRTAAPAAGTGVTTDGAAGSITATIVDTRISGWNSAAGEGVTSITTPTAPVTTKVDVNGTYKARRPNSRGLRIDMMASRLGANQVEGKLLTWTVKVDGHRNAAFRQHAGDTDIWARQFRKHSGTHRVEILKNGVQKHAYLVSTR